MKITELNHVALHVRSIGASARFYGEFLGLPAIARPDFPFPGAWFRIGIHQELHLIEEGLEEPASERGHFALRVADIEEAARHLQAKKVAFNGPFRRPDGALQIFTEDPDGHTVELCWLEGANRP